MVRLLHGLNEWLDMLALGVPDSFVFGLARLALMSVSFAVLLEFGRRGLKNLGVVALPARWLLPPLVCLGAFGLPAGLPGMNAAFRHGLALPGAILAALAFWHGWRKAGASRGWLGVAAVVMAVYALAAGLVVPRVPLWPVQLIDQDEFLKFFSVPIQVPRTVCAFACMACVWLDARAACTVSDRRKWLGTLAYPVVLMLAIAIGWRATEWRGGVIDRQMRNEILAHASGIARTVNPDMIQKLTFTKEDAGRPEHKRIRDQMVAYGRYVGLRSIYSVGRRGGNLVFGPQGRDENDTLAMPAGAMYADPPEALKLVFHTVRPVVAGPYTDENGVFISGFAPVVDPSSGRVLLVIGVDLLAYQWAAAIIFARMQMIGIVLVVTVILLAGLSFLLWRDLLYNDRTWWARHVEPAMIVVVGWC
jgi:hypothetical protein